MSGGENSFVIGGPTRNTLVKKLLAQSKSDRVRRVVCASDVISTGDICGIKICGFAARVYQDFLNLVFVIKIIAIIPDKKDYI